MTFSSEIIQLNQTESTNQFASSLVSEKRPDEGTAIVALFQSSGKGQRGNVWRSESGKNLLASLILYPDFIPVDNLYLISQMAAVSIIRSLKEFTDVEFQIKWPNDIMWKNNKVGGILIENSIKGNYCGTSIVGIGLNLNQTEFPEFIPAAASVNTASGINIDPIECINIIRQELSKIYEEVRLKNYSKIQLDFTSMLFRKNEFHFFESEGTSLWGSIIGVDEKGHLILETEKGILTFGIKEIKYCY